MFFIYLYRFKTGNHEGDAHEQQATGCDGQEWGWMQTRTRGAAAFRPFLTPVRRLPRSKDGHRKKVGQEGQGRRRPNHAIDMRAVGARWSAPG